LWETGEEGVAEVSEVVENGPLSTALPNGPLSIRLPINIQLGTLLREHVQPIGIIVVIIGPEWTRITHAPQ
jgi:hypothetical protein